MSASFKALPDFRAYGDRLAEGIRRYPKLASGFEAPRVAWVKLVGAFCVMIEPLLSRYRPDTRLVATITEAGTLDLHRISRGIATHLGVLTTIDPMKRSEIAQTKWTSVELRVPPNQLLRRSLSLPVASRDFLGPIIQHRLERLVPWQADRVLYGYQILADKNSAARIELLLIATSRDLVAAPLQDMREANLSVTAVGAQSDSITAPLGVNILRDAGKGARMDARRLVSRIAMVSFGILFVIYLGSLIWAQSERAGEAAATLQHLDARRALKGAAIGANDDRDRILLDMKTPDKAVVVLIDRLAIAIPADTYLKELSITADKVRLTGVSGNAPALVREIETTGLVNVRFSSVLTRGKDQRDSFEITADRVAVSRTEPP